MVVGNIDYHTDWNSAGTTIAAVTLAKRSFPMEDVWLIGGSEEVDESQEFNQSASMQA